MIHPQSSVWSSAAQVFITAKPCILRSTGRRMCLPKSRWWMGPREGLCAASLWLRSITGAAGKHRELEWGSGFGLVGAALGVSGSKKHHTNILGFCSCSVSNRSQAEQEQKQRRALAPSLPLAEPCAQPDSSPGSLAPLSPCAAGRTLPDRLCSPWMLRGSLSNA